MIGETLEALAAVTGLQSKMLPLPRSEQVSHVSLKSQD